MAQKLTVLYGETILLLEYENQPFYIHEGNKISPACAHSSRTFQDNIKLTMKQTLNPAMKAYKTEDAVKYSDNYELYPKGPRRDQPTAMNTNQIEGW